ncbi:MAG: hypothetical protein M1479_06325 [Actinobacteria bacterium]|nr:hypothetical protein [Actinomycetota bacterium]
MDFIPPELQENNGEFEAALNGNLPKLIGEKELRGIFHIHTIFSNGNITIKVLCEKLSSEGFALPEDGIIDISIRPKHQIPLPLKICKKSGLEYGDKLELKIEENTIIAKPKKL